MRSWGGGIVIYRSYALYEEEKTYNVLKGTIPDFNYDVKLAVTIDGKESKTIPTTPYVNSKEGNYYQAKVDCDNDAEGEWDYNSWNLKVDYLTNTNTKCKVEFTSNIKKEDYDAYIQKGVATRRNTYRGKELTLNDEFYKQIQDGTFKDIYVGDYFATKDPTDDSKTITWLVADIDNYLYTGKNNNNMLTQHHATIIPAAPLMNTKMNDSDITTGGYYGSKMVSGQNGTIDGEDLKNMTDTSSSILDNVLNNYITPVFNSHIIEYGNLLSIQVDPEANNRSGSSTSKGASSNWTWYERKLDLMSVK